MVFYMLLSCVLCFSKQQLGDGMKTLETNEPEKKPKIAITCKRCGKAWSYGGTMLWWTSCPDCRTSVRIPGGPRIRQEIEAEEADDVHHSAESTDEKGE